MINFHIGQSAGSESRTRAEWGRNEYRPQVQGQTLVAL